MIKNIKYSNGSLFVLFTDEEFVMQECDKDTALQVFNLAQEGADKETVFAILDPQFKKLVEEVELVKQENQLMLDLVDNIVEDKRFYLSNNQLYRQGIPLSIPKTLALRIQESIKNNDQEQLNKLDKFWAWSSLIRIPESRESLFPFIEKQKIQLTDDGLMITYRRVVSKKNTNVELVKFVTQEYFRLRKVKKSTNVEVYEDTNKTYTLKPVNADTGAKNNSVGNLKELFNTLNESSEYSFTDNHSNSWDYRIGKEVRMSYTDADWDVSHTCSKGFHSSGINFGYSGFGNIPIACIVNPKDVVAAVENSAKLRSLAFTPIAVLNEDCEWQNDVEVQKVISEVYQAQVEQLETLIKESDFKEFKDGHTLVKEIPNISLSNLFSVIKSTVNPNLVKERLVKV